MLTIPMQDLNSYVLEANMDDRTYFLQFDWNSEAGVWTLSISDAMSTPVLSGLVLVANTPLLKPFHYLNVPPGEIILYTEDDGKVIDRNTVLTDAFELVYLEESEYGTLST